MAVPATGGALAGAIFQQAVDFGEYYVAQGNTDVNHIATSAQIKDYLSDSKKIALLKSLVRANPWKNLPFVKGDALRGIGLIKKS